MSRQTRIALKQLIFALLSATAALLATLTLLVGIARADSSVEAGCDGADQAPRQVTIYALRSSVLCLINRVRAHYQLTPLRFNEDLSDTASAHSREMVVHRFFAHDGFGGGTVEGRIVRSGYLVSTRGYVIGENIGGGMGRFGSPLAVLRSWMHSPPHRENLLSPVFHDVGVGVARGFPGGGGSRAATYTLDLGDRDR